MLYCPKCKTPGVNLHFYREDTITGPVASIKCSECCWVSGIIIDGRIRLVKEETEELPDYSHLLQQTKDSGKGNFKNKIETEVVEIVKEVEVFRDFTFSHKGVVIAFEKENAEVIRLFLEEGSKLDDFQLATDIATIIHAFQNKKLVWKK